MKSTTLDLLTRHLTREEREMGLLDKIAPLDKDGRPNGNTGMILRLAADRDFRKAELAAMYEDDDDD